MNTLPLTPGAAVPIGQSCSSLTTTEDGLMIYFAHMDPFDFHDAEDRGALLLRAARLAENGVRRADLQAAFGLGRATLQRAVTRLRQEGEASFQQVRPGRRSRVLVGARQAAATRRLAQGLSGAEVARRLGVKVGTVNANRRQGRIGPASGEALATTAGNTEEVADPDDVMTEPEGAKDGAEAPTASARTCWTAARRWAGVPGIVPDGWPPRRVR